MEKDILTLSIFMIIITFALLAEAFIMKETREDIKEIRIELCKQNTEFCKCSKD